MIPAFPVYLFDVDGTLLDSQLDICGAIQTVLAARGRTDITHEALRIYIGRHLLDEFLDLGFTEADIEEMIQEYRTTYAARKHASTSIYPGSRRRSRGWAGASPRRRRKARRPRARCSNSSG